MVDYVLKAESGTYNLSGQDAELRHVAPLPNDHPILAKLGSISSNRASIEWSLRKAVEIVDQTPAKLVVASIANTNQLSQIGSVLKSTLDQVGVSAEIRRQLDHFLERLSVALAERNRLDHDPWHVDQKTGELVQFRTRGDDKVVVVATERVDSIVDEFRTLDATMRSIGGEIWQALHADDGVR